MRGAALFALIALALLAATPGGLAHADLAGGDPAPGKAGQPVGLSSVVTRFTETIDLRGTNVTVVLMRDLPDGSVEEIVVNAAPPSVAEDGYAVAVPVTPLDDGVYGVRWRALSTTDGHTTHGSYLFAVGLATLRGFNTDPQQFDERDFNPMEVLREGTARAVYFFGLFVALGVPLFALVVLRGEPIGARLLGTAGAFSLLGGAGGLLVIQFLAQDSNLAYAEAAQTIAGSLFLRRALLVMIAGAALLVALALPARQRALPTLVALVAGLGALVTTSLGSHAAGVADRRNLAIAVDMLHLLMGGVWIGGVVAFLHVAWGRSARDLALLITRFTPLAITSVVVLLATGSYASLLHIPRVTDLWLDPYGRLVLGKILLMGPLIMLGAYNSRVLAPRLHDGRAEPRFFRRAIQVEALVMAIVLMLAGALAASAPPDKARAGGGGDAEDAPFTLENVTRRSHVVLEVRPAPPSIGEANLTVIVHTAEIPDGMRVYVVLTEPGATPNEEDRVVVLDRVGPQDWSKEGAYFTRAGDWTLRVTLQYGAGIASESLTFIVPVGSPGGGSASSNPNES